MDLYKREAMAKNTISTVFIVLFLMVAISGPQVAHGCQALGISCWGDPHVCKTACEARWGDQLSYAKCSDEHYEACMCCLHLSSSNILSASLEQ